MLLITRLNVPQPRQIESTASALNHKKKKISHQEQVVISYLWLSFSSSVHEDCNAALNQFRGKSDKSRRNHDGGGFSRHHTHPASEENRSEPWLGAQNPLANQPAEKHTHMQAHARRGHSHRICKSFTKTLLGVPIAKSLLCYRLK